MAVKLFSEYQPNVDAYARRIAALTSLSSRQAALVADMLLGRKTLKIKSSALAQIFLQVDADADTKKIRNEFIKSDLIERIEGTGKEGKPAFYTINAKIEAPSAEKTEHEAAAPMQVDASEQVNARNTPKVKQRPVAQKNDATESKVSSAQKGKSVMSAKHAVSGAPDSSSINKKSDGVGPKSDTNQGNQPARHDAQPVAFVSKVGRGARIHRRSAEERMDAKRWAEAEENTQAKAASQQGKADKAAHKLANTAENASTKLTIEQKPVAKQYTESDKKSGVGKKPEVDKKTKNQPASKSQGNKGTSSSSKKQAAGKADSDKKEKSNNAKKRTIQKNARDHNQRRDASARHQHRDAGAAGSNEDKQHAKTSSFIKSAGERLAKALPFSKRFAKDARSRTAIVKLENTKLAKQQANASTQPKGGPARKLNQDVATVMAWIDAHADSDAPYASRRQRAYEIFNDEKAFDGKRGERLFKRLNDAGVNLMTLHITPNRPVHFTGFYNIGSNRPFIMVENLDTYDEIVRLLRGRSNALLFGTRVGGVIFGGGCKAAVSHALDDYLAEIGYTYDFVYYAGDIDREGARIVEQARDANVTKVRLHVGMYKAMLARHRDRLRAGMACEPASTNQGVPQNLAETIRDLPVVTRVQFRNVLRDGGRIPQEILTTSDFRDADSSALDRALNR